MKIRFIFAWYDCWVGFFWDAKKCRLYIFPVPMLGFYVENKTSMKNKLESAFRIGQRVTVAVIQTMPIYGYVRAITFTSSKVRYAIWVKEAQTTMHNIDSAFVFSEPNAEIIEMPDDNYS